MFDGTILDFTDRELAVVQEVVKQRYRKDIEVQLADSEVKLDPNSETLVWAPTANWGEHGVTL